MAADSAEHLLSLLPRDRVDLINSTEIENDRKIYWEQFYSKYSAMSEEVSDEDTVSINDIDDKKLVNRRRKHRLVYGAPVSKTARRFLREHAEAIDEMTTVAGPPASDEEEIAEEDTDEDEDESMELISCKKINPVKAMKKVYDEANNEVETVNSDVESSDEVVSEKEKSDIEGSGMDSDEDLGFFSPRFRTKFTVPSPVKAPSERSNTYIIPTPAKKVINRSKQTTVSPATPSLLSPTQYQFKTSDGVLSSTPDSRLARGEKNERHNATSFRIVNRVQSLSVTPSRMRRERNHGPSVAQTPHSCPGCGTRLDESSLMLNSRAEDLVVNCDTKQCDNCLVNNVDSPHKECELEECKVCIDIAVVVSSRNILRESFAELSTSGIVASEENWLKNVSSFVERNECD